MSFYVYEHWRTDKNECFYVGKGKDKRAWDMKRMRNCHHMAITSKLAELGFCVDVKIVSCDLSENDAFDLEISRIAMYGLENLSNMTSGGDGLRSPSKETREKISKSQKIRFARPSEKEAVSRRNKCRVASDETRLKLSIASKGRTHSKETIEKFKIIAKKRGFSDKARKAQIAAATGRKRAPFSKETIEKMCLAASKREAKKRLQKGAV